LIDRRFLFALPLALLAACNDTPSGKAGQGGQVLQGSISDEMLPVERLTSEPPTMAPEPEKAPASSTDAAEDATDQPSEGASESPAADISEAAD